MLTGGFSVPPIKELKESWLTVQYCKPYATQIPRSCLFDIVVCVCVYVFITFPNPANSCSVCKLLRHQCPALPSPTLPHLNCPEMKQSFLLLSLPKERVTKNLGEGYLNAEGEPLSSLFAFRDDYIFPYFLCKLPFVGTILILSNHFLNHLSNSASEGS